MSKWLVLLSAAIGIGAVAYKRYRTMKECERQLDYYIGRLAPLALAFALEENNKKGGSTTRR
jgi:hypothetical protein